MMNMFNQQVKAGTAPPKMALNIFASNELSDNDFVELQRWCAENVKPYWSTGIGLIDAADIIVSEAVDNNNISDDPKKIAQPSGSVLNVLLSVEVGDKYKVVQDHTGRLYALRNGEEWRDLVGDNLVLTMAQRIEELEEWRKKAFDAHPNIDLDIEWRADNF